MRFLLSATLSQLTLNLAVTAQLSSPLEFSDLFANKGKARRQNEARQHANLRHRRQLNLTHQELGDDGAEENKSRIYYGTEVPLSLIHI